MLRLCLLIFSFKIRLDEWRGSLKLNSLQVLMLLEKGSLGLLNMLWNMLNAWGKVGTKPWQFRFGLSTESEAKDKIL